jgi:hypothetical protein
MNMGNSATRKYLLLFALALAALTASNGWARVRIANTAGLAFGSFAAGTGGTVVVSPAGVRSKTGGVLLVTSTVHAASFNVRRATGSCTQTYTITLPANGTVTLTSGPNSMAVNNFVSNPSGSGQLVGCSQVLTVGATLTVAAGKPAGNYSGTFRVTVVFP